jgi:uncharacterized protein YndB with AHSA1/START domain
MWLSVVAIVGLIVLFLATMAILGMRLPEEHAASLTLKLNQTPHMVWETISDIAGHKNWAKGVTKVERLSDHDNHEVWKQYMGRNVFVLETTTFQAPVHLVRTIADERQMFSGSWEYMVLPDGAGTKLQLTERGRVKRAVPRAMMHYLFSESMYLRRHLVSLAEHFGEKPRFE